VVEARGRRGDAFQFDVTVGRHRYAVTAREADVLDLAGGRDATALVEESFRFLLEREPPSSIMNAFDLSVIERYFPEYRNDVRRRLRR